MARCHRQKEAVGKPMLVAKNAYEVASLVCIGVGVAFFFMGKGANVATFMAAEFKDPDTFGFGITQANPALDTKQFHKAVSALHRAADNVASVFDFWEKSSRGLQTRWRQCGCGWPLVCSVPQPNLPIVRPQCSAISLMGARLQRLALTWCKTRKPDERQF